MTSTAEGGGTVEAAVNAFSQGKHVVVLGSDENGGEGLSCSLALMAESASPESVAFMIRHSTGILSAAAPDPERFKAFRGKGAGTAAVDFLPGSVSGTSAKERANTLRALSDTTNAPTSFRSNGHISLLSAAKHGVLEIPGVAEAACDLCRLASKGVVALAELMRDDGEAYSVEDAQSISKKHGLPIVSVADIQDYRRRQEAPGGEATAGMSGNPVLQTEAKMWIDDVEAECLIKVYSTSNPKIEVVTVVKGTIDGQDGVPARVHSECFTGDILASKRCDCGQQLHKFLRIMNAEPCGVLLYVRGHEGRGIGLANKIKAYHLQDEGLDTVDANLQLGLPVDTRTYEDSLFVLRHLGVKSIRLYTNNPEKTSSLQVITKEVVALASVACERNMAYLKTKRERLNHRTVLETFKLPKLVADTAGINIGVVYTSWNKYYVDELLKGALGTLEEAGVKNSKMVVSGATELISGARAMIRHAKPQAVLVLGVLIRGNSDLYDATCTAVMNGLMELNASQDTPIISGVLMCQNEDQAHERSRGSGNPARAWAETALHMSNLASQLQIN